MKVLSPQFGDSARDLPVDALVTRSLCRKHNSELGELDLAAWDYVNALRRIAELRDRRARMPKAHHIARAFTVDGWRLERWAMKTIFSVARTLRQSMAGWETPREYAPFVFASGDLAEGAGLGMLAATGARITNEEAVGIRLGKRATDEEISAALIDLRGGYRFVVTWGIPLGDMRGFADAGRVYLQEEGVLLHPNGFGFDHRLELRFDWTRPEMYAPEERLVGLRERYAPPKR